MSYNYKKEYKKWYIWKTKEEEQLKNLNIPQSLIDELRRYDYEQFKAERRYRSKHIAFHDNFFMNVLSYPMKQAVSLKNILDEMEDENLYEKLKMVEVKMLRIIDLRLQGYSIKEISNISGLTTHQLYKKLKKLKNLYKSGEK